MPWRRRLGDDLVPSEAGNLLASGPGQLQQADEMPAGIFEPIGGGIDAAGLVGVQRPFALSRAPWQGKANEGVSLRSSTSPLAAHLKAALKQAAALRAADGPPTVLLPRPARDRLRLQERLQRLSHVGALHETAGVLSRVLNVRSTFLKALSAYWGRWALDACGATDRSTPPP